MTRDTYIWIDHPFPSNMTFDEVDKTYPGQDIFPDDLFDGTWSLVQTTNHTSNPLYVSLSLGWAGDFRLWPINSKVPSSWNHDKRYDYYYATTTQVYLKDME